MLKLVRPMVCIIMPSLNASHKFPGQQEREYLILGRPTSFFPSTAYNKIKLPTLKNTLLLIVTTYFFSSSA
jgi:hypothetical protein